MADPKECLLPPRPLSSTNLRDTTTTTTRPFPTTRPLFQGTDFLGLKKHSQGLRSWIHVDTSRNSQKMEVVKFTMIRRYDLPARDLCLLNPLFVYPSTILGREKAIMVNLEQIRCIITADEVLLLNSLDSYVLQYVVELQKRLTFAGVAETWDGNNGDLLRWREGKGFDHHNNVFGNSMNSNSSTLPDYLLFEFRALEVALEAACTFLDAQGSLKSASHDRPYYSLCQKLLVTVNKLDVPLLSHGGLQELPKVNVIPQFAIGALSLPSCTAKFLGLYLYKILAVMVAALVILLTNFTFKPKAHPWRACYCNRHGTLALNIC